MQFKIIHSIFLPLNLVIGIATCQATSYQFVTLEFPPTIESAIAYDINNLGQITGVAYDSNHNAHGFVIDGKKFTLLDYSGATQGTYAFGINEKQDIVGNYVDNSGKHGFIYSQGRYTTLDHPTGYETNVTGINNSGLTVGNYRSGTGIYGFQYAQNTQTFSLINNPAAAVGNSTVSNINDSAEVVGFTYKSAAKAFSYAKGVYSDFSHPYATAGTFAYGINNQQQIVGVYYDASGVRSYLFDGKNFTTLSAPKSRSTTVNQINDLGQIVGFFTDNLGNHAFMANPVSDPVPGTSAHLEFVGGQNNYHAGDVVALSLEEMQVSRDEAFDLWVGLLTPEGKLLYLSGSETSEFSQTAKPFARNVSTSKKQHVLINLTLPSGITGRYQLYAVFTALDSSINDLTHTARSNIAQIPLEFR